MTKDIFWTTISQGLIVISLFIQFRIVKFHWGVDALSSYSMIFRVRGALEWIILIVLPLATTKYLSYEQDINIKWKIALVSFLTGLILISIFSVIFIFYRENSSLILFGATEQTAFVLPFCAHLISYCLFLLVGGIFRGFFAFRLYNFSNVVAIALIPACILFFGNNFELVNVILIMGVVSSIITIAIFLFFVRKNQHNIKSFSKSDFFYISKNLFAFGGPRLLTLIFNALFLMALPWLISINGDIKLLASFNSVMAIISGSALLTAPVGFVLMPHFSRALSRGEKRKAALMLRNIIWCTFYIGAIFSVISIGLLEDAMVIWLGKDFAIFKVLFFSVSLVLPAFAIIDLVRAPNDAASNRPYNALTYFLGFSSFLIFFYFLKKISVGLETTISISILSGYIISSITSIVITKKLYKFELQFKEEKTLIIVYIVIIAILGFFIKNQSINYLIFFLCLISITILTFIRFSMRIDLLKYLRRS